MASATRPSHPGAEGFRFLGPTVWQTVEIPIDGLVNVNEGGARGRRGVGRRREESTAATRACSRQGSWKTLFRPTPAAADPHLEPGLRASPTSNAAAALPRYLGRVTDNRHGLVVKVQASTSDGTAERHVAAQLLANVADPGKRATVAADKADDTKAFLKGCRDINVTPHVQ